MLAFDRIASPPWLAMEQGAIMTKREIVGRTLITLSILLSVIAGIVFDWTVSHFADPNWSEHARFHVLTYHGSLLMIGVAALWCLWGRCRERAWALWSAWFMVLVYWLPFYPAALVPGVSPIAVPEDVIMGMPANLTIGTIHLCVTTCGVLLARRGTA